MRHIRVLHAFVLGMMLITAVPAHAERGCLLVTVDGVTHQIDYLVYIEQRVSDLRDPARFRVSEGVFLFLEVFDAHPTKIIEKASVETSPTPGFPEGAEIDLALSPSDPGDTGVDFFMMISYPDAYIGTFRVEIKLTTGHKIVTDPFQITLQRLPDLQNVQFLDDTTKPVLTWDTIPGVVRYRVKVQDPDTGVRFFVGNPFFAAPGPVQMQDLKTAPGFPIGWPGMEIGKLYVVRIEGRLEGNAVTCQFVTLPAALRPPVHVPGAVAGQGRITRALRHVEYTPLSPVFP